MDTWRAAYLRCDDHFFCGRTCPIDGMRWKDSETLARAVLLLREEGRQITRVALARDGVVGAVILARTVLVECPSPEPPLDWIRPAATAVAESLRAILATIASPWVPMHGFSEAYIGCPNGHFFRDAACPVCGWASAAVLRLSTARASARRQDAEFSFTHLFQQGLPETDAASVRVVNFPIGLGLWSIFEQHED